MIQKIKSNKFIIGTIILLTGGFLSKLLGFILKIIITRKIGTEGIGLYSLIMPTFGLFITIATFSFPLAVSKLTSLKEKSTKKILISSTIVSTIINILSIIILYIISKPLTIFLKQDILYYPIICIGFTLPFIGISSIIKGYFWGKQKMGIYILSNITEQIIRIIVLSYFIPIFIKKSIESTLSIIILVNILSETSSIFVMLLGFPKNIKIRKKDLKPSIREIKDIVNITLPSTTSKIIGSIAHFFEPIIMTNLLTYKGLPLDFIVNEYGIINGYAISLLILPQFFTQSISTSLIPEISKYYEIKEYKMCIKRIKEITYLSLIIGLISTLALFIKPQFFLNLIYKVKDGTNYIRILAPFFLLFFIETPLSTALQAMNKNKEAFFISSSSSIIRLASLIILILLNKGIYSLIISICISILYSSLMYYKTVKKSLNINHY